MTGQLVTVASFDQPAEAHVARNVLEAAGIRAVVTDEQSAGMLWHIATALSGAKVQVIEADADRALAILEKELGADGVDPEELAAAAEAAKPEDGVEPPPAAPGLSGSPATEDGVPSERDEYARRAYRAGLVGLIISPVAFYALYLVLNAAFGEGSLSDRGRFQLRVGAALTAVGLFILLLFFMFS